MKTDNIIKKNVKLLLRSRISTIVLTLGPLLVILLVGLSFSTNTFNLQIGVYSSNYSQLSNDLVVKLQDEGYQTVEFPSEDNCVQGVRASQVHACVVFPPHLSEESAESVTFHVDQSKINLVYLVMSTLRGSFGEKSSEISKDLTDNILTTLFNTKTGLEDTQPLVSDIESLSTDIESASDQSSSNLNGLDFSVDEVDASSSVADMKDDLDELLADSTELVDEGLELVDDLDDHVDGNGTSYLNDLEDALNSLNSTIKNGHNATAKELLKVSEKVDDALSEVTEKLDAADQASSAVINNLNDVKTKSASVKEKAQEASDNIDDMISDINSIRVTDSQNIVSPISMEVEHLTEEQSNLTYLFPSLVVMMVMFIGLLLPSTLVIMEKNSRAYFRTFTTPTKGWLFILGTFLTSVFLISIQLIIILGVSHFYFNIDFFSSFALLLLALSITMTFFILLGMSIGYIFSSEEMAMLAAVSIGTLFLLTSGIIFPIESMPEAISEKAKLNPVVLGSDVFRSSLLYDSQFDLVKTELGYLLLFSAVALALIFFINKSDRLQHLLRKPGRKRQRKQQIMNHFDFGKRKAKNLPEFIVSIQNMSPERVDELQRQNAIRDWVTLVYKDRSLAQKVEGAKTRDDVLALLVNKLKKDQNKS